MGGMNGETHTYERESCLYLCFWIVIGKHGSHSLFNIGSRHKGPFIVTGQVGGRVGTDAFGFTQQLLLLGFLLFFCVFGNFIVSVFSFPQ